MLSDDFVYMDTVGHGTEVTGVIAATPNNNIGISGTCWNVAIVPIAVVHYNGTIYTSDVVNAIYLAADAGCKVINLSLGSPSYSAGLDAAVQYATSMGSIVVASAGNDSNSTIEYPASLNNVISVGSINKYLSHSFSSNYNSYVDVSAPGEDILTTYNDYYSNSYAYVDGTSFSSPYVAGIAALAATAVPGITPTQFKDAIMVSSTDLGFPGRDNYFGYGLINAEKLLKYITPSVFVPVTGVSLNKSSSTLIAGANETLTATISPANATNKNVTWQSSNTAVATVDSDGNVVGINAGTAVITVTTIDGSKTAICTVSVLAVPVITKDRIYGNDRIGTAINVADKFVSATTAILAPAADANLVDALAAAPLAGKTTPILLTDNYTLSAATKVELIKLGVTKIYVVGAISQAVFDEVKAMTGVTAIQLKGADRIATAALISAQLTNIAGSFVVGYGALADALSVASFAAAHNYSIVVTNPDGSLPSSAILGSKVYIIGGPTLVNDISGAIRLYGSDRFATNKKVLETLSYTYSKVYVANGLQDHLVDSLVASSLAASVGAPIILTDTEIGGDAAVAYIGAKLTNNAVVVALGGVTVVSDNTVAKVISAKH